MKIKGAEKMKIGKKGQGIMSPQLIIGIVVSLIILVVGVYAFFTTTGMIPSSSTVVTSAVSNVTNTGNQVFNVIGIVLTIGAIMLIVTMVYSYTKP